MQLYLITSPSNRQTALSTTVCANRASLITHIIPLRLRPKLLLTVWAPDSELRWNAGVPVTTPNQCHLAELSLNLAFLL